MVKWLVLLYSLVVMLTLLACREIGRALKSLEAANRGLREQNEIMLDLLWAMGGSSLALLASQERFETGGRTTVPGKEDE